jgi:hypothetical protein
VLHLFVPYQRRVVGENDVTCVALVAVFVFQVVVHRPFDPCGKGLVAEFANVLTRFYHFPITRVLLPYKGRVWVLWADSVLFMSTKLWVEGEAVLTIGTSYRRGYIVDSIKMRVEGLLCGESNSKFGTTVAFKLSKLHVNRFHMSLDVVLELWRQSTNITAHQFKSFWMVKCHVSLQSVLVSERFGADFTHEAVITVVKLHVSLQAEWSFTFNTANLANLFAHMVVFDVFVLGRD